MTAKTKIFSFCPFTKKGLLVLNVDHSLINEQSQQFSKELDRFGFKGVKATYTGERLLELNTSVNKKTEETTKLKTRNLFYIKGRVIQRMNERP